MTAVLCSAVFTVVVIMSGGSLSSGNDSIVPEWVDHQMGVILMKHCQIEVLTNNFINW